MKFLGIVSLEVKMCRARVPVKGRGEGITWERMGTTNKTEFIKELVL